jgi:hypothetical protein
MYPFAVECVGEGVYLLFFRDVERVEEYSLLLVSWQLLYPISSEVLPSITSNQRISFAKQPVNHCRPQSADRPRHEHLTVWLVHLHIFTVSFVFL